MYGNKQTTNYNKHKMDNNKEAKCLHWRCQYPGAGSGGNKQLKNKQKTHGKKQQTTNNNKHTMDNNKEAYCVHWRCQNSGAGLGGNKHLTNNQTIYSNTNYKQYIPRNKHLTTSKQQVTTTKCVHWMCQYSGAGSGGNN